VDSLKIDENTRFILSGGAFSVVGIDKISNLGLLSIRIKKTDTTEDDNLSQNIANYYSNQHTYTISITNGSTGSYGIGQDIQINVEVYMDGVLMDSPVVQYVNANEEVATISSLGLLSTIGSGTTIVTVTSHSVSDSIAIEVTDEVVTDVYTVDVSGANTVKLNNNVVISGSVFNNGVVDSGKIITWSFSNQDGSGNAYLSLVSSTSSSITLKATSNSSYVGKYVVVRGSKSDDALVYDEIVVQIKSLF
jgi:hypothetical protein